MPEDSLRTGAKALERLSNIKNHMAQPIPSAFTAENVPQAPEDPLFGMMAAFRKDTFEKKVDLGIGAYRDNNAKPWVLPVVKKVRETLITASVFICVANSPLLKGRRTTIQDTRHQP